MVSVSLGLILETLSPGFDLDPAMVLCFLCFAVRYVCSFGNKAVLCKAWSSKAQTPCPWWGTCTTFNLCNIFCPIESTWIKCTHAFNHSPGSCPQSSVWTHILSLMNHHAYCWYHFSCDEPQLLAWVTQDRSERMMWTLETSSPGRTDPLHSSTCTTLIILRSHMGFTQAAEESENAVVRAEIHPSVPWCCVEWCGVLLPSPEYSQAVNLNPQCEIQPFTWHWISWEWTVLIEEKRSGWSWDWHEINKYLKHFGIYLPIILW